MKVILLEDINNFGKKYEVKEVKEGFARNFLIPRGLAKIANDKNLKQMEAKKGKEEKKAEEELKKIQQKTETIDGQEFNIKVKAGENNQLFESITSQKISEVLKKRGFDVKKDQIILEEPIKELGEFPVKINFKHNLEAEIKIIVSTEES